MINCENVNLDFLGKITGLEKLALINCGNFDPNLEPSWSINLKFLNELKNLKVLTIKREEGEDQNVDCSDVDPCKSLQILKIKKSALSKDGSFIEISVVR